METNHNHTDEAEWYMVKDEVWAQATKQKNAQYLCVGCLERRLDRTLIADDFAQVLGNFMPERFCPSARLQDRMRGLVFDEAAYRARHGI